ncbi:hypothetical protein Axi01nite_82250 [Actinoplanes xinjiangensis]|nr:hypothetical protein Axi01nite_82250 [Actinoplanes xinjiangensis]
MLGPRTTATSMAVRIHSAPAPASVNTAAAAISIAVLRLAKSPAAEWAPGGRNNTLRGAVAGDVGDAASRQTLRTCSTVYFPAAPTGR